MIRRDHEQTGISMARRCLAGTAAILLILLVTGCSSPTKQAISDRSEASPPGPTGGALGALVNDTQARPLKGRPRVVAPLPRTCKLESTLRHRALLARQIQ